MLFEKIIQIDDSRDLSQGWEKNSSIEMTDEQYRNAYLVKSEPENNSCDVEVCLPTEIVKKEQRNEKSKSKSPTIQPKKANPRAKRSTVESV